MLAVVFFMGSVARATKKTQCLHCQSWIKKSAIVCKACGRDQSADRGG